MSYLAPAEFVTKMVDAGESKIFMSTRDTLIRAYMAGAILCLAAAFAVMVSQQTGYPIIGAILFPVGFCMLYLLGFDPGDGRIRVVAAGVVRQAARRHSGWRVAQLGPGVQRQLCRAFTVPVLMSIVFTSHFSTAPNAVGQTHRAHRRVAHARLQGTRRGGHAHAVHPRDALQLDGFHRRRGRDDLHVRDRQGDRDVDARSWCSSR
jgi:hypothetical protein